jgi:hypothetical protein
MILQLLPFVCLGLATGMDREDPDLSWKKTAFGPKVSKDHPDYARTMLLMGAHLLHEWNEEFVEGGCGPVCQVLKGLADKVGLPGVEIEAGVAKLRRRSDPTWHAWLRIGGVRLDPVWKVVFGRDGVKYEVQAGVLEFVSYEAEEEDLIEDMVEWLHGELLSVGWDLQPGMEAL